MTDAEPDDADPPERRTSRRPPTRTSRRNRRLVPLIVAGSAVAGALAGAQPTGTAGVDHLLAGALAAAVTLAASRAQRGPVLAAVAVGLGLARGPVLAFALSAAATALVGATRPSRDRAWGAATGALAVQALLRLDPIGPHGTTALAAGMAATVVLVSGYQRSRPREKRQVRRVVLAVGGLTALVVLAYGALLLTVAGDVTGGTDDARAGLRATRQGDTDAAREAFARSERRLDRAGARLDGWWAAPTRVVPVLAQHARALGSATEQGRRLAGTAEETVDAASYSELRSRGGQVDLDRVAGIRAPLRRTADAIADARRTLAADRSPWLAGPLDDELDDISADLDEAAADSDLALQGIDLAPALLGADGPRRYLVVFVTPAELRGAGGFVGSYAEVTADDGRLALGATGSAARLTRDSPTPAPLTGPQEYLDRYGQYDAGTDLRDLTFSPHFPYDGEVISEVYPQMAGRPIDGVISVDPVALAALLRLTGPIDVPAFGRTLRASDAAEFLLRDNYSLFPDPQAQDDALSDLVERTFDELTTGDLPGPRRLSRVLGPVTREGRIRLWSPVPAEQELFARLGATGALPEPAPDRDLLAIASQNSGNNKLDVYLRRRIDYRVVAEDGDLRATATVTVRNEVPLDAGLPEYVTGNSQGDPIGTNRMVMSIYTPHLLEQARVDGERVAVQPGVEAGYRVYTTTLVVPPGGQVTFELDLVGRLTRTGDYVLDLVPQPTVVPDELSVRVDTGGRQATSHGPAPQREAGPLVLRPED